MPVSEEISSLTGFFVGGATRFAGASSHDSLLVLPKAASPSRQRLAVKLFDDDALTQGQAAKLAGLSLPEFFAACAARQVPVARYEAGELERELEAFEGLRGGRERAADCAGSA
jgi:predicted HTH domain antitoxin